VSGPSPPCSANPCTHQIPAPNKKRYEPELAAAYLRAAQSLETIQ
jgi:hypothetical protein